MRKPESKEVKTKSDIISSPISLLKKERQDEDDTYSFALEQIKRKTLAKGDSTYQVQQYYKYKCRLDYKRFRKTVEESPKHSNKKYYFSKQIEISDEDLQQFAFFHRNKQNKIRFLKTLLNMKGCFGSSNKGQQICSSTLAHHLHVTPATICNYLKDLQRLDILSLVDARFSKGKISRRWVVVSPLLREFQLKYVLLKKRLVGKNLVVARLSMKIIKRLKIMKKRSEMWKKEGRNAMLAFAEKKYQQKRKGGGFCKDTKVENENQKVFSLLTTVAWRYVKCPWDFVRDFINSISSGDLINSNNFDEFVGIGRIAWNYVARATGSPTIWLKKDFVSLIYSQLNVSTESNPEKSLFFCSQPFKVRGAPKAFINEYNCEKTSGVDIIGYNNQGYDKQDRMLRITYPLNPCFGF
jgi:hypothetical protein